ncbi:nucleoside-diphosphate kinase, partial [Salmonella sp. s54925]|uniref:nucleoside-diphosphate kinase n=1 Tax=Salmonella sp. s54925 TaxID=3159674 RepID=UPI003980DD49
FGATIGVGSALGGLYVANNLNGRKSKYSPLLSLLPPVYAAQKVHHGERTFIMIKPDGVHRALIADIIKRFEQKGFKLVAMKFLQPSEELLNKHYEDLSNKPFF